MNAKLLKILEGFRNKKILVIGDIMLDKYIWGEVTRVSPEAPVQVVEVQKENYVPGGAANVANNVASLNGSVFMVGTVGDDSANKIVLNELKKRNINTGGILRERGKPTIQKIRIMGRSQQLLRVDYEKKGYLNKKTEQKIIKFILGHIKDVDGIIVSDYAKGVVTNNLMASLKKAAKENSKMIIIDPKPKNRNFYENVAVITPNSKEAQEMSGIEEEKEEDIIAIGKKLLKELNSPILLTRGEKGMSLFEKDGKITNIPTKAKEVYDVTGAGDTVVAALALALASGATISEAAIIANHAAGIKVAKIGTATVTTEEIKKSLGEEGNE